MSTRIHLPQGIVDGLIENQIKNWQVNAQKRYKEPIRHVITFSRLPGAGGMILAKELAKELKIDYFDHEIVEAIAKNAKVSESVIETLDEEDRSIIDDWIAMLDSKARLWSDEYLNHLKKVIIAIGAHGYAVILGRGAGFILPMNVCLRVLIVAPLETRIQNVAKAFEMTTEEARNSVIKTETDRVAFIKKYYKADMKDPVNYDLVINTENVHMGTAVQIVCEAYNTREWYHYSEMKV
jgi:cytidylate kinase